MGKILDLTGERYGRLVVVKEAEARKYGRIAWVCECECGKIVTVTGNDLRRGRTSSCGCYRRETATEHCKKDFTTHGETNSRLFRVWVNVKKRCYNPHYKGYKDYGGRGICICEEWRNSYEAFRIWALANGYDENAPRGQCTLDRINNNGNYEPANCRWVDMKTQAQNRRPRGYSKKDGETK